MQKSNTSMRLKFLLKAKNIRQNDVLQAALPYAKQYGVRLTKNDISAYVNGRYEPKQDKLTVLALALDVTEAWLMGYDVPMTRNESSVDNLYKEDSVSINEGLYPESSLAKDEAYVIKMFRSFSKEGKEKVLAYIDDLNRAGVYKINNQPGVVSKEA